MSGWTKSYRKKWTHEVFRNFRDAAIWSYLIDNAAWEDGTIRRFEGMTVALSRGQIAVSERFLADGFACDRSVIRTHLNTLSENHMVTQTKTHRYTIITICNYNNYQGGLDDVKPTEKPTAHPLKNPLKNPNIKNKKESKKDISGDSFSEWYAAYPHKKDPGLARTAYAGACKKTTPEVLLASAMAYADDCAGKERKFIKHPTTWLHAESWLNGQTLFAAAGPGEPVTDLHTARWIARLNSFATNGHWEEKNGPPPGTVGCAVPANLLETFEKSRIKA